MRIAKKYAIFSSRLKMLRLFGGTMDKMYEKIWESMVGGSFDLSKMENALLFRLCALRHCSHTDKSVRLKAFEFVKQSAVLDDCVPTEVGQWANCDLPDIKAKRESGDINALVYSVNRSASDLAYEIGFFQKDKKGFFRFDRKEDLKKLYDQYCRDDVPLYHIRQIGDAVLHKPAREVVNFQDKELKRQLEILKKNLYVTGGVGIAANQCAELENPLRMILSGVDYHHPEHIVKAVTRYKTTLFPPMKVLINPVVINVDDELSEFSEGCLSVRGSIRGVVKRPKSVTVGYQDIAGAYHEEKLEGSDARVMQHELDHILNGLVYMQRLIQELSLDQCVELETLLKENIETKRNIQPTKLFLSPMIVFNRDHAGRVVYEKEEARKIFSEMSDETLVGIKDKLQDRLCELNGLRARL